MDKLKCTQHYHYQETLEVKQKKFKSPSKLVDNRYVASKRLLAQIGKQKAYLLWLIRVKVSSF